MKLWIVLTAVFAAMVASEEVEVQVDEPDSAVNLEAAEAGAPQRYHGYALNDDDRRKYRDHADDHNNHDDLHLDKHRNVNVDRVLNPSQVAFDPHNKKHIEIIENVYAPDYHEPYLILDYRYQKTGGRDWTRADGGQILILPKGIKSNEPKEYNFRDYDELLDHLREKSRSEINPNKVVQIGPFPEKSHSNIRHNEHGPRRSWSHSKNPYH